MITGGRRNFSSQGTERQLSHESPTREKRGALSLQRATSPNLGLREEPRLASHLESLLSSLRSQWYKYLLSTQGHGYKYWGENFFNREKRQEKRILSDICKDRSPHDKLFSQVLLSNGEATYGDSRSEATYRACVAHRMLNTQAAVAAATVVVPSHR